MADTDIIDSTMLGGLQPVRLPRIRHERQQREEWEAARLCSMRHHLTSMGDPPLIFDVGSELGDLSVLYALWGCDLVLCEPNPPAWPWARLTFEANRVAPWHCWWGFVSDQEQDGAEGGWTESGGPWPTAALADPEPETSFVGEHERGGEWPSTTIDRLAYLTEPPDAITCDNEGYELRTMLGAQDTLAEFRPLVWLSEHDDAMRSIGDDPADLAALMASHGYDAHFLATDHERHMLYTPPGYVFP